MASAARPDIGKALDTVAIDQRNEAVDGRRMPHGEYRAPRPLCLLLRQMFQGGLGFTSIAPILGR